MLIYTSVNSAFTDCDKSLSMHHSDNKTGREKG